MQMGRAEWNAEHLLSTVQMLAVLQGWRDHKEMQDLAGLLQNWVDEPLVSEFLGINEHEDILWFNQEGIQEFSWWLMVLAVLEELGKDAEKHLIPAKRMLDIYQFIEKLLAAEKDSNFQLKALIDRLKK